MEAQLLYAEKLSLLGQLAPRIAHELKAPLQLISGHAELAQQWLLANRTEEAASSIQAVLPSVEKLLALLRQMSDLGKPEETRRVPMDLGIELEHTLAPLQSLGAVKHCKVIRQVAADLPPVAGDPAQLEQVFRNLIVNAAQAMEGHSPRVLTVAARAPAAERVEVVVEDTGPGIAPEDLERIFQPFYTTKPEGTGLGLPIVRTVLDRHGASVAVHSEPGIGTRFVLSFPAVSAHV
jgi:signal transduction histidine kinase